MTFVRPAQAAFNKDLLMDDVVFSDSGPMNAAQINAFLNSFAFSCISPNSGFDAREPTGYNSSAGFTYGDFVSAGQVIATSAQVYGINPQVLLVTLEKEQSLVTGRSSSTYCNGSEHKYAAAMGYGCPDSGGSYSWSGVSLYRRGGVERTATGTTCVNTASKAGFSQQTIRAAWLLKFSQERSLGNTNWAVIQGNWDNSDDLAACYSGYMTQGTFKRCPNGTADYYDGWATIDGTATHMDTGATASLYRYTPHFHGNENFVSLFESWFGPTVSPGYYACRNGVNISGAGTGVRVMPNRPAWGADRLSLVQLNNTGSACIELHTFGHAFQGWLQHVATNRPSISPADSRALTMDGNADGMDELVDIEYRNTSSGKIEVHIWDPSYQKWVAHIATISGAIDPADAEVIAADADADGRDELYLVQYRNTGSGMIEIHGFGPTLQNWSYHVATNRPAIDPADAEVISADVNGDSRDEFLLVQYRNTSSGKIEVHGWAAGQQQWFVHTATNRPAIDPGTRANPLAEVISADINGNLIQELHLIQYGNTGSGRVEVHTWAAGQQQWIGHVATAQASY